MNLVDVKNALETIVKLNPGLSKDKLVVLLKAASWEDTSINEALVIFKTMSQESALPHVDNENLLGGKNSVTEVHKTKVEELALPHVDNENLLEEGKKVAKEQPTETRGVETPLVSVIEKPATKSGIWPFAKKEEVKVVTPAPALPQTPVDHLPEGLPLKAFDSSEHVWTFSEYKEKFHGAAPSSVPMSAPIQKKPEPVQPVVIKQPVITVSPVIKQPEAPVVQEVLPKKKIIEIDEPLNGSDLSLVVVVSFLFLVIILLLGYMYSNGRLFL